MTVLEFVSFYFLVYILQRVNVPWSNSPNPPMITWPTNMKHIWGKTEATHKQ
jgi:hypothetical protein